MPEQKVAPYGSWASPITADLIASGTIALGQIALDGEDIYWSELRPTEGGRVVVVRHSPDGRTTDVTSHMPWTNCRTRVHEYGGGAFAVADGTVYFTNFADQRLYRQDPGATPRPLTPATDLRYADGVIDRARGRIICVREDHTDPSREAVNTVVSVALNATTGDDPGYVLVSGNEFYSSPRLSPDGARLAWLTWNHPNMPWDGTELWVAQLAADGSLVRSEHVAGGVDEWIFQPEWSPDGVLYFVSDRSGWWNLYRLRDGRVEPLYEMEAEFGLPQWVFGASTYGFAADGRIICAYTQRGTWQLAGLDVATRRLQPIDTPYSTIGEVRAAPGRAVFRGGSATEPLSIVRLDPDTGRCEVLRRSSEVTVDPGYLSIPEAIEFPTEHGLTAHGFFYAPRNRDYTVPSGERPPLLVKSHGGPTSATSTASNLGIQYWTSRGIAVLDVNYGGSAGGYTTLCALTFRDAFKAGASYFGVSDAEALAKETHKFESRYLDRLIGPYPAQRDLYRARSPIHFADRLSCPTIFFQGLEDKVVPPNQAERMVEALRARGVPVAYVAFEGEQHGFRRAETIKRSLEAELYFYSRVFGFALADQVEPVPIDNM